MDNPYGTLIPSGILLTFVQTVDENGTEQSRFPQGVDFLVINAILLLALFAYTFLIVIFALI